LEVFNRNSDKEVGGPPYRSYRQEEKQSFTGHQVSVVEK
jgi:hypothetical protein